MGEASDDDVVAREHVHDIVSGRLPAEDVASNIAEDLRRIRSQLAAVTKERDEAWNALRELYDGTVEVWGDWQARHKRVWDAIDLQDEALAAIRAGEEKK